MLLGTPDGFVIATCICNRFEYLAAVRCAMHCWFLYECISYQELVRNIDGTIRDALIKSSGTLCWVDSIHCSGCRLPART